MIPLLIFLLLCPGPEACLPAGRGESRNIKLTINHKARKARPNDRYPECIAKLDHTFCRAGFAQSTQRHNYAFYIFAIFAKSR
jgi:hypothetical protein